MESRIKKAKKRRDRRTILMVCAMIFYLIFAINAQLNSENNTTIQQLLLPLTIGIVIVLLSMIYSEGLHFENTKQLIEMEDRLSKLINKNNQ